MDGRGPREAEHSPPGPRHHGALRPVPSRQGGARQIYAQFRVNVNETNSTVLNFVAI